MSAENHSAILKAALFIAVFSVLSACKPPKEESRHYGRILMGTSAEVTVYGLDEQTSGSIADAVFKEWDRLDKEYSFTDRYSIVSYINRKAPLEWVAVSDECYGILEKSIEYFRMTGGSFDVTFAPVWELWKKSAKADVLPDSKSLKDALSKVGSDSIMLDPRRQAVRFSKHVQINLGGVLKDYALLKGKRVLDRFPDRPPKFVLLNLGGDILAYGRKSPSWSIGVRDPMKSGVLLGRLGFEEGVVLTSGSYERFVEIAGRRYCHIIDTKTGYPLKNFSGLTLYLPDIEAGHFTSLVAVFMGRKAGLEAISKIKGAMAIWTDGSGRVTVMSNPDCPAVWK